jgi:hypothetical protein
LGDSEADEDRAESDEEGDGSAAACDVHAGQECISGSAALSSLHHRRKRIGLQRGGA